ncbi:ABC transporter involved in cytochrome c biogenesis, CcmB subunit [Bathymodiolus thermophilus thioautotrophic gill symbiont]|uniref:Heme exporter protein B n=1 Tax=Bathymodiolus thermophilus thioautotrophic gill symbiont TaxID=2360 RepID=A0A1J5U661_9GAMM|nr:heme exporter protein CcmB [Bathymodiolus thermophilus thioautotrophic gill symbiont]AYQ56346.1 heme exporter protein B [Bathymodiolus thermophilus thioautotrophic gill symbiont]OIR24310.1 heme exporter protein CcmB [Bathymodiolus thermophilus thioautotrophic gill symbiont]CAB5501793.1 ABC transporter involved in cytochrome c biogenesis, CcmB subunit [Bathymodiolus thermophilus thioautotrophic gill symbiont]CAB5506275.1 ABC transporter involved in cytochrome c biogenesis, CcmB subunit [Bathy
MNIYLQTLMRDLHSAIRNLSSILNPLLFFIISISLFPLAISPEASTLSQIAAGIIWVASMLAVLLSLNSLFHHDFDNGVLEQMLISHHSLPLLILSKIVAHWLLTGVPIILLSPLLGVFLFLDDESIKVLMLTLLLATPSLSLIGAIGASLIVSIKNSGMLLSLLILPLYIPILIFASSAVSQAQAGLEIDAQLYFLATILTVSLMLAPFVSALSLRISLE